MEYRYLIDVSKSVEIIVSEGNNPYIEGPFLETEPGSGLYDDSEAVSCVDVSTFSRKIMWRISDSRERRNSLPYGSLVRFSTDGWIEMLEGGAQETIGNYFAPLRYDLWKQYVKNDANLADSPVTRYEYLNYRAHTYEIALERDATYIGNIDDIGDHSIAYVNEGKTHEKSVNISAVGYTNQYLLNSSGQFATEIDVSGGEQQYSIILQTACGNGLEKNTIISIDLGNGVVKDWVASESVEQGDQGTFVVTSDRFSGGNKISFTVETDNSPSTTVDALQVTIRQGTPLESIIRLADITD